MAASVRLRVASGNWIRLPAIAIVNHRVFIPHRHSFPFGCLPAIDSAILFPYWYWWGNWRIEFWFRLACPSSLNWFLFLPFGFNEWDGRVNERTNEWAGSSVRFRGQAAAGDHEKIYWSLVVQLKSIASVKWTDRPQHTGHWYIHVAAANATRPGWVIGLDWMHWLNLKMNKAPSLKCNDYPGCSQAGLFARHNAQGSNQTSPISKLGTTWRSLVGANALHLSLHASKHGLTVSPWTLVSTLPKLRTTKLRLKQKQARKWKWMQQVTEARRDASGNRRWCAGEHRQLSSSHSTRSIYKCYQQQQRTPFPRQVTSTDKEL